MLRIRGRTTLKTYKTSERNYEDAKKKYFLREAIDMYKKFIPIYTSSHETFLWPYSGIGVRKAIGV